MIGQVVGILAKGGLTRANGSVSWVVENGGLIAVEYCSANNLRYLGHHGVA